ncbi:hypothetical protein [Nocardia sp. NPDC059239]|uniref:hypothetical protein n=1 Tax=unclassified Nocardia TaxID=2637762 RepID=UPI00369853EC
MAHIDLTPVRQERGLHSVLETASAATKRAVTAEQEALESSDPERIVRLVVQAKQWRHTAAIAHARHTALIAIIMSRDPHRSHVHDFQPHPDTGKVICACGLNERAAAGLDPDYITTCHGCDISPTTEDGLPVNRTSRVHCYACDQYDRPIIHRGGYEHAICAGCGRTAAEAGQLNSWSVHYKSATSASVSAQSCGGTCGEKVDAMRDRDGILKRIPRSATGRMKPAIARRIHA